MNNDDPRIKKAYLFKKMSNGKVQCNTCYRYCVIEEEEVGYCKTRKNIGGILYTLIYGDVSSYSLNPIEKKPAYHYYPGSTSLTLGSWGCNFPCDWCQNWEISKTSPPKDFTHASLMTPEKVVENASFNPSINGLCFSFNEPVLSLEFAIDSFHLLSHDYYKHFVTNGYMTPDSLELLISSGMSGMTVSFKGTSEIIDKLFDIKLEKVWENLQIAYQRGVHIELVYLIIPTLNEEEHFIRDFIQKTRKLLSSKTPIHFTRFFPSYLSKRPKTSITEIQKAYDLARKEGMEYVYVGNIPGHPLQSTYCPDCSELLVKRDIFSVTFSNLTLENRCPSCNKQIPVYPYRPVFID